MLARWPGVLALLAQALLHHIGLDDAVHGERRNGQACVEENEDRRERMDEQGQRQGKQAEQEGAVVSLGQLAPPTDHPRRDKERHREYGRDEQWVRGTQHELAARLDAVERGRELRDAEQGNAHGPCGQHSAKEGAAPPVLPTRVQQKGGKHREQGHGEQ